MRLRSLLFVPGDRPDQIAKAAGLAADALILDLEDSVAPDRKPLARAAVAEALQAQRRVPLLVRINPLSGAAAQDDLEAVIPGRPAGLVLPKAEGAASIRDLQARLEALGGASCPILPITTETAAAMFRLGEYAEVSQRLLGLTWGAEDLSAAVGAETARDEAGRLTAPYEIARSLALFAARAAGVAPIETVYPDFRDLDGLSAYARRGARDGFTGMMAIHPAQLPAINAAFTPSAEAVDRARRIVEAFAANPSAGVVALNGEMLDAPHLIQARNILARAGEASVEP